MMEYSLYLGCTSSKQDVVWQNADNPHMLVSGCSGTGKSHCLRHMIRQMPEQGVRCVIFDCSHDWGQLTQTELADVDMIDVRELGINPLAPLQLTENYVEDASDTASRLAETIRAIYRLLSSQENRLNEALYVYLSSGKTPSTLSGLVDFICCDKKLWRRTESVLPHLRNLSRVTRHTDKGTTLNMDCPGITVLDFSRVISTTQQSLLVELVLSELWSKQLLHRENVPIVTVLDEVQRFSFQENSFLCRILREGRKFNLAIWAASQWISDKKATAALEQAALRMFFRPEASHVRPLARQLAGSDKALAEKYERIFLDLKRGQFLYHDQNGRAIKVFVRP